MWEMAKSSILLFVQGKLFAEPNKVYRQTAIGAAVTAALLVVLAKVGVPLPAAAGLAGLVGGALQPYLFKDLRYR
jgi:hypothetical protein